ncbi:MAG: Gfo/Idh/MocA family oxidoreductase [Clostridiales bacterium]|nr:Gfo/Idh/MocA family oxidoreductase [Clostridiales bacterium]
MKLCFVGCGGQAIRVYADALARYRGESPGVLYAACCDVDLEKAALFQRRAGFERVYGDCAEMMRSERPGAVIAAAPFQIAEKIARDVLAFPCAIMLEKPLGRDLADCLSIARAAEKNGMTSMAAFNRRFMPLVRFLARELKESGSPLRHISYAMHRVDRREDYFYSTAIHGIDLARHIAGADYQSAVFAYENAGANGVANTQVQAVFANGVSAQLSFCPTAGLLVERLDAIAEGQAYFVRLPIWEDSPDMPGSIEKYEGGRLAYRKTGLEISDGESMFESNGFYAEVREFLDCARRGTGTAHGVETAIDAMRVMDCMKNADAAYSRAPAP